MTSTWTMLCASFASVHTLTQAHTHVHSLENTRECVVCLSDLKDTAVLPCRHMCLCSQCGEQLRHQSNRCPICRQRA
jgi:hypothetical protein